MGASKFLCSNWIQDMEKWFGQCHASLDSSLNEAFLQCQCIMTCEKAHITHYIAYVAPNYKNILFTEWGNHTWHQYMLEPILLSPIWTIASMQASSNAISCESRIEVQVMRVVIYAHFAWNKFESLKFTHWYKCFAFDHIWLCVPHIFDQTQSFHEFLSQSNALSVANIYR